MCEPLEAWGVQKEDQIALIRDQIIETKARIESGELTPTQEKGFRGLHLKAVRQLSELTGQLRTTVDFEGTKLIHEIVGVDMAAALPDYSPRDPMPRFLLLSL